MSNLARVRSILIKILNKVFICLNILIAKNYSTTTIFILKIY